MNQHSSLWHYLPLLLSGFCLGRLIGHIFTGQTDPFWPAVLYAFGVAVFGAIYYRHARRGCC